jgi:PIN domain nuclease of toxin-antitoxin system
VADYFFDSSALVKAYLAETGTGWVRAILDDPNHRISISALAEVEVIFGSYTTP